MPTKKFFQIEMLRAAHGDCLWIEYGTTARTRRILIDGGPIGRWESLESRIGKLKAGASTFELIVLTHVDTDHVDGLVRLFAPKKSTWKFDAKEVWFNGWKHLQDQTLGGNQGEFFSALIEARMGSAKWNAKFGGKTIVVPDAGELPTVKLVDDFKITLLSPTPAKLKKMKKAWEKDVKDFAPGDLAAAWEALATQKKYLPDEGLLGSTPGIDAQLERQSRPDNAAANGATIAFLAEYAGMSALFLGDAHPDAVVASLSRLVASRGVERLQVDAVKIAHHGSKGNTTDALLALIDSPRFLISSNGAIFDHPDAEAIKRIISRSHHQPPTLLFNYRSEFTNVWDDDALRDKLNYQTVFSETDDIVNAPLTIRLTK